MSATSTDPGTLANQARCVDCIIPIGDELAVQTYLLALIAGVDTTDPSALANSARCYLSCIPIGEQMAVQNYLLCQIAAAGGLSCPAPPAPTNVVLSGATETTINVAWSQSATFLVSGYLVSWGTSPGTVIDSSGTLPATPLSYTMTGLDPDTTYYVTVQAISNCGTSSASSVEVSAATSANPNTLLVNIAAYWKLDEASNVTRVDATGNGENLTDTSGNVAAGVGKINNGVSVSNTATQFLTHADDANIGIGAGVSFSISCWYNQATHDAPIVTKWNSANAALQDYRVYVGTNGNFGNGFFWFSVKNLAGVAVDLVSNVQSTAAFHHIAAGYDDALQQIWIQVDNGVRISTPCVGVRRTAVAFCVGNYAEGAGAVGITDELGFWRKSITTTEVSKLYNAGAGIQYPFTGATAGTIGATLSAYTSLWWQNTYANSGDASNNGGPVSSANLAALDGLYTALNSASLLSKVIALNCLTPDNIVAAMWPFIGVAGAQPSAKWTNSNFVIGDLTINGLKGDGTTKSINTGINLSTALAGINSSAFMVYVSTNVVEVAFQMGIYNGAADNGIALVLGQAATDNAFIGSATQVASSNPVVHGAGYYCASRTSSTSLELYFANSGNAHASIATQAGANAKTFSNDSHFLVFADYDPNSATTSLWSAKRMSCVAVFSGLTAADSLASFTALQAYLVARGGGSV